MAAAQRHPEATVHKEELAKEANRATGEKAEVLRRRTWGDGARVPKSHPGVIGDAYRFKFVD